MSKQPQAFSMIEFHGGLLMHEHLTEERLGHLLRCRFGDDMVKSQYTIPGTRYRMDYVINFSDRQVAIEFDGPRHYTSAQQIQRDILKTELVGMEVIRIPLWLQLDQHTSGPLGIADKFYVKTTAKHGWVTDEIYPASYCEAGFDRFLSEAEALAKAGAEHAVIQALSGLLDKADELGVIVLTAKQRTRVEGTLAEAVKLCDV